MPENEETDLVEPEIDQEEVEEELPEEETPTDVEPEKKPEEDAGDEPEIESLKEELEEEGFEVTIEGEKPKEPEDITQEREGDSSTIKQLRRAFKEKSKEALEFKQRLADVESKIQETRKKEEEVELGPVPDLYDDGIDGDTDKLVEAKIAWKERQQKIAAREEEQREKKKQEQQAVQEKLSKYQQRATSLGAPDYKEAEEVARQSLSKDAQFAIVDQSEIPEKIVYAIGKREDIRKQFEEVKGTPFQQAVQVGRLLERYEKSMSITPRKKSPPAEKKVTGGSSASGSFEARMKKAEEKSEKTGDRSEIIKLLSEQKNKT